MPMPRLPLVSIALPFYNNEGTLALSIKSILKQTYQNYELLLCDDGSTDSSLDVALSFRDPRITVWSDKKRVRLATRLNQCVDKARGDYIARMDGDDVSYPQRLEQQVSYLLEHKETDLLSGQMLVFKSDGTAIGKIVGPAFHQELTSNPIAGIKLWHGAWVGKASWFRAHRYDPTCTLAQDQELLLRSYKYSRFAALPEVIYGCRQDKLVLRKMLRYRLLLFEQKSKQLTGEGAVGQRFLLGASLLGKAAVETVAMVSGLQYRVLRHRARPLSESEMRTWRELWRLLLKLDSGENVCGEGRSLEGARSA
jgi:glycosyltransferase involved in cell wall biosynthesis